MKFILHDPPKEFFEWRDVCEARTGRQIKIVQRAGYIIAEIPAAGAEDSVTMFRAMGIFHGRPAD
jgi:hypothetical protein